MPADDHVHARLHKLLCERNLRGVGRFHIFRAPMHKTQYELCSGLAQRAHILPEIGILHRVHGEGHRVRVQAAHAVDGIEGAGVVENADADVAEREEGRLHPFLLRAAGARREETGGLGVVQRAEQAVVVAIEHVVVRHRQTVDARVL